MNPFTGEIQHITSIITKDIQQSISYNLDKFCKTVYEKNSESHSNFEALKELPFIQKLMKDNETLKQDNERLTRMYNVVTGNGFNQDFPIRQQPHHTEHHQEQNDIKTVEVKHVEVMDTTAPEFTYENSSIVTEPMDADADTEMEESTKEFYDIHSETQQDEVINVTMNIIDNAKEDVAEVETHKEDKKEEKFVDKFLVNVEDEDEEDVAEVETHKEDKKEEKFVDKFLVNVEDEDEDEEETEEVEEVEEVEETDEEEVEEVEETDEEEVEETEEVEEVEVTDEEETEEVEVTDEEEEETEEVEVTDEEEETDEVEETEEVEVTDDEEEEEEEEYFDIEIDGVSYFVMDEKNSPVYEVVEDEDGDEDIGEQVGMLKNGKLILN
jgi:hypothetical protein